MFESIDSDLRAVIAANILDRKHKKYIIYQLFKALKFIHTGELIHRDLKPSNIFINKYSKMKLGDFGLARSSDQIERKEYDNSLTNYIATRFYRAPEI